MNPWEILFDLLGWALLGLFWLGVGIVVIGVIYTIQLEVWAAKKRRERNRIQ